jgi:hypothetical protein
MVDNFIDKEKFKLYNLIHLNLNEKINNFLKKINRYTFRLM